MKIFQVILSSLCALSAFASPKYVRPLVYSTWSSNVPVPTSGVYGSQDGSSYANAWNGLNSVIWSSVTDELYLCGSHIALYTNGVSPNVNSFAIHGIVSDIRVRGDYPGDPGLIFGGCVDKVNTYVWNGPDANGVYSSQVQGSGNTSWAVQFEITNGTPYRLLSATNSTWVGQDGECFFVSSSSNYVKTLDGVDPTLTNLALGGPFGWYIYLTNGLSNIVFQSVKFVGGGIALYNPGTGPGFYGITNLTFTNCALVDGANSQGNSYFHVKPGDDYWNILNCEIARTGEGIQADLVNQTRGALGWNVIGNYFHDINTREFPTTADPHAVGVQGGSFWNVISNRIERCGQAIDFWSTIHVAESNLNISYNYIQDINVTNSAGGGIVIEGDSGPDLGMSTNCVIEGNILNNIGIGTTQEFEGGGIDWERPDYVRILNNTIHKARNGIQLRNNSGPALGLLENNIISQPYSNFLYITGSGTSNPGLTVDYSVFYTNAPLTTPFRIPGGGWSIGTHNIFQNPQFSSATPTSSGDFQLSGISPAIHAGTSVGVALDFYGVAFGNPPSIGAFEYQSVTNRLMRVTNLHVTSTYVQ